HSRTGGAWRDRSGAALRRAQGERRDPVAGRASRLVQLGTRFHQHPVRPPPPIAATQVPADVPARSSAATSGVPLTNYTAGSTINLVTLGNSGTSASTLY